MKKILIMLSLAGMVHVTATAQSTNTGTVPNSSLYNGNNLKNTTTPNSGTNANRPAIQNSNGNSNYRSHYQPAQRTPATVSPNPANTNTPATPNTATPNTPINNTSPIK